MGTTDNSFWARIQQGLSETGNLMTQKQYNIAMIKARQTLEYMVNYLGEKALIVEGDLADSIDQLYEGQFISQTAKDHYHRIRMLGNKAVHEGNDSPYDANEIFQLLTKEVNDLSSSMNGRKRSAVTTAQRPSAVKTASTTQKNPVQGSGRSRSQASRNGKPQAGSSRTSTSRNSHRTSHRTASKHSTGSSTHKRSRRRSPNREFDAFGLLKPALIFLVLLVLALICVKLIPGKDNTKETTAPELSTEATTEAMPTQTSTEETEPETDPPKIYTTKSKLNVRSQPSTDGPLLGSLAPGTVVDHVETYDDKWSIITFEGKQAYIATEFLTVSEDGTDSTTEAESSSTAQ